MFSLVHSRFAKLLVVATLAALVVAGVGGQVAQADEHFYSGSSWNTNWSYGGGPNGIYFNSNMAAQRYGGGYQTTPFGGSYYGYNNGMQRYSGGAYGPGGFNQYGGQGGFSNQWGGFLR